MAKNFRLIQNMKLKHCYRVSRSNVTRYIMFVIFKIFFCVIKYILKYFGGFRDPSALQNKLYNFSEPGLCYKMNFKNPPPKIFDCVIKYIL